MILFALLCTVSLIITGTNVGEGVPKIALLNRIFNISYYPFITYFMAKNVRFHKDEIKSLLLVLSAIGVYLSLTSIFERYNVTYLIWPKYILDPNIGIHFGRSRGPFTQSVFLGFNIVLSLCSISVLWVIVKKSTYKHLMLSIMLIYLAGIYFTNTRGPWVALGIVLITGTILKTGIRKLFKIIIVIVFIGYLLGVAGKFSLNKRSLFSSRNDTVSYRVVNYKVAWLMGISNPFLGVGFGRMGEEFDYYYRKIGSPEFVGWDGNHNEFLGIFAEVGLFAIILYLSIIFNLVKMAFKTFKNLTPEREFERCLTVISLCALLGYCIIASVSDIHSHILHNNLVFLLSGIVANINNKCQLKNRTGDLYSYAVKN